LTPDQLTVSEKLDDCRLAPPLQTSKPAKMFVREDPGSMQGKVAPAHPRLRRPGPHCRTRTKRARDLTPRTSFLGLSYDRYVAESPQPTEVAEKVAARIAVYVGPHTARVAVKSFALRKLGRGPESLELEDIPALLAALRPMLRTLIGQSQCELALKRIERELGL